MALGCPPIPADVEHITWLWVQHCQQRSGQQMAKAIGTIHAVARHLGRFFEQHDILLTPTCAAPSLPLQQVDMRSRDLDDYYDRHYNNNTFTTLYNCTGVPAVSLPLVWTDGLPIGIQLAAPLGSEMRLLQVSARLEQAHPWADRRPGAYTDTPSRTVGTSSD